MTWGSLFIIDPAFTLPLIVGLVAVAVTRQNPSLGYRINAAMLTVSTLYLGWCFAAKHHVQGVAEASLAAQGRAHDRIVTLASPFNTILWRIVAMDGDGYHVGWYSLLDEANTVEFQRYPSDPSLLGGIEDHWPVARSRWKSKFPAPPGRAVAGRAGHLAAAVALGPHPGAARVSLNYVN